MESGEWRVESGEWKVGPAKVIVLSPTCRAMLRTVAILLQQCFRGREAKVGGGHYYRFDVKDVLAPTLSSVASAKEGGVTQLLPIQ